MMKPKLDAWTIVIAGAWNVRVFSAEWVGKQLFDAKPMTIEVPIGPTLGSVRYAAEGLALIPADDRLIVGVQAAAIVSLQKAEALARKTLGLLPHTPITAFGVNLGFEDTEPGQPFRQLFVLHDLDPLSAFGAKIKRTNVVRTLEIGERTVNVTHALAEDGSGEVHLNFHQDTTSAAIAAALLEGRALASLEISRKLMTDVYECTLEENDDEG